MSPKDAPDGWAVKLSASDRSDMSKDQHFCPECIQVIFNYRSVFKDKVYTMQEVAEWLK